jgi:hypothetical protein
MIIVIYSHRHIASFCELVLTFSFVVFLLTYYPDLKDYTLTLAIHASAKDVNNTPEASPADASLPM